MFMRFNKPFSFDDQYQIEEQDQIFDLQSLIWMMKSGSSCMLTWHHAAVISLWRHTLRAILRY